MKTFLPAALIILTGLIMSCTSEQNKDIDNKPLLGAGTGISGATLVVQKLDSARNYYTNTLGFDLPKAEKFEQGLYPGTISALVNFPDQSFLELLAVNDTGKVVIKDSFVKSFRKNNQGVRLYSLSTSSTDSTFRWLASRGLKTDSIKPGRNAMRKPKGWSYDDGGAQWRTIDFDTVNPPAHLPNFMEYVGFPYQEFYPQCLPIVIIQYSQGGRSCATKAAAIFQHVRQRGFAIKSSDQTRLNCNWDCCHKCRFVADECLSKLNLL